MPQYEIQDISDRLKATLLETELRLEAKLEAFKSDIIKFFCCAIGFQTLVTVGALVALLKLGVH